MRFATWRATKKTELLLYYSQCLQACYHSRLQQIHSYTVVPVTYLGDIDKSDHELIDCWIWFLQPNPLRRSIWLKIWFLPPNPLRSMVKCSLKINTYQIMITLRIPCYRWSCSVNERKVVLWCGNFFTKNTQTGPRSASTPKHPQWASTAALYGHY